MSLIDQALKKTQTSLHKQKKEGVAQPDFSADSVRSSFIPSPDHQTYFKPAPKDPFYKKNKPRFDFEFPTIDPYFMMISAVVIIAVMLIIAVATHFKTIEQRYANFYHIKKAPVVAPKPIAPPVAPLSSLSLEGTMQAGNERVAMINGSLYHTKDMIGGYQIKQIRYNTVVLENPTTHHKHQLSPTMAQ